MLAEKSKWGAMAQGNLQTSKLCQSVLFEGDFIRPVSFSYIRSQPLNGGQSMWINYSFIHLSRFEIDIMRSVGNNIYVYMVANRFTVLFCCSNPQNCRFLINTITNEVGTVLFYLVFDFIGMVLKMKMLFNCFNSSIWYGWIDCMRSFTNALEHMCFCVRVYFALVRDYVESHKVMLIYWWNEL